MIANANACAGFSLGEYTALVFAGILDVKTALQLLKVRGNAMAEAASLTPTGMMTVIGLDDDELGALCDKHKCSVANQLFDKGRVVSGGKGDLEELETSVKATGKDGLRTIMQKVSGGFHSKYMQPAKEKLEAELATVEFKPPNRRVYSNVTALPHSSNPDEIKAKMAEQLIAGASACV